MSDADDAEIRFSDLVAALRRSGFLLLFSAIIGALLAFSLAIIVPKMYEASIMVEPLSSDRSGSLGGLSSLASQFGGLAALAGVSPQMDAKKSEAIAVMQSEQLIEMFIRDNKLLPILYPEKWNAVTQRWKDERAKGVPTLWKANRLWRNSIASMSTDTKTGMVKLTIKWKDAAACASWANGIIKLENEFLRDQALRISDKNIAYLNDQAAKTDAVGVKLAIYSILQDEIDKSMIARGSEEYALKIIDPAFVPENPTYPRPLLWTVLGGIFGLLIATFIAFLRVAAR